MPSFALRLFYSSLEPVHTTVKPLASRSERTPCQGGSHRSVALHSFLTGRGVPLLNAGAAHTPRAPPFRTPPRSQAEGRPFTHGAPPCPCYTAYQCSGSSHGAPRYPSTPLDAPFIRPLAAPLKPFLTFLLSVSSHKASGLVSVVTHKASGGAGLLTSRRARASPSAQCTSSRAGCTSTS